MGIGRCVDTFLIIAIVQFLLKSPNFVNNVLSFRNLQTFYTWKKRSISQNEAMLK